jgi:hypothetical protein
VAKNRGTRDLFTLPFPSLPSGNYLSSLPCPAISVTLPFPAKPTTREVVVVVVVLIHVREGLTSISDLYPISSQGHEDVLSIGFTIQSCSKAY